MKFLTRILDSLNLSHTHKKVSGNIAWLVGGHVYRMGLGIIVIGMLARYLGPHEFGIFNYAISLAVIFSAVANLGIDGIVIRELVKEPEKTPAILGTAFILRVLGAALAIGSVFVAAALVDSAKSTVPYVITVSVAFLPQAFEVVDLWFQKHIQSKYSILARSVAILLGAILKIALVMWKCSLMMFCIAYVMDFVFIAGALIWVYAMRGQKIFDWDFSVRMGWSLLRDSWPLILSGILVAAYLRIEQILVMGFLGSYSAGIYFAASKIMDLWVLIPSFILNSVYPILVDMKKHHPAAYARRLQSVFDALTGLGYVLAAGTFICAWVIIRVIYGYEYRAAIPVLMIQALTAPIIFSGSVRGQYFLLENCTIYHTWSALIGILTNVALAFPLMDWLGAKGAAVAALIGYWVSAYGTSYLFRRLRECASLQTKAFLLPFRVPEFLKSLRARHED